MDNKVSEHLAFDAPCACGGMADKGVSYGVCCQPYHLGEIAPSAEALMRARYSAITLKDVDYIIATTLPAQAAALNRQLLAEWMENTQWLRLNVLNHSAKIGKRHAEVLFEAHFSEKGDADKQVQIHKERSAFVRLTDDSGGQRWYFLDPTVPVQLTGKQSCLCGSGEKFKACCGKFLW